jgi:hypothetical protein
MASPPERDAASVAQRAALDQRPMTQPDLVKLVATSIAHLAAALRRAAWLTILAHRTGAG